MWFQFPKGCESISVEQQEFHVEATDKDGRKYFRAPNHFSPRILAIGGFVALEKPPVDFPEDLPKADPQRDGAIVELTQANEALKIEVTGLRTDLNAAVAKIGALVTERDNLSAQVDALTSKVTDLEEELEDKPAPAVEATKKK